MIEKLTFEKHDNGNYLAMRGDTPVTFYSKNNRKMTAFRYFRLNNDKIIIAELKNKQYSAFEKIDDYNYKQIAFNINGGKVWEFIWLSAYNDGFIAAQLLNGNCVLTKDFQSITLNINGKEVWEVDCIKVYGNGFTELKLFNGNWVKLKLNEQGEFIQIKD